MDVALALLSVVIALVAALLSAADTAVMLLPVGRVFRLVEAGAKGADSLEALSERSHRLKATSMLVGGAAYFGLGMTGLWLAELLAYRANVFEAPQIAWSFAETVLAVIGATVGIAIAHSLTQALPRTLAVANPERMGLDIAPVAGGIVSVVYPVARLLSVPWRWMVELAARDSVITPWATSAEGRQVTDEDAEREEAEEALLEAVSEFGEKVVREVMVPRTDVAALSDTATAPEAIRVIEETGYSRLPVYHESIDDVRGMLYAKDLLVALNRTGPGVDISTILRRAHHVPETKPVEELLVEMRSTTHIAVVADEYGGTAGIVTLEDLLEEIVGEISDEYDQVEQLVIDHGDGRYSVDARLPVDDLNELIGTDLDTEADSVGGLISEISGTIPEVGASVLVEGLRFTVTEREGTRIRQLSVEPVSGKPTEGMTDEEPDTA